METSVEKEDSDEGNDEELDKRTIKLMKNFIIFFEYIFNHYFI